MKFKTRRIRHLFVRVAIISSCSLWGLYLASALHSTPLKAMPAAKAPQSVSACFPKAPPVSTAKLVFSVRQSPTNYYLMSSDQSEGGTDLLISVDERNNRCSLLLFNPMGDTLPLSRFVPIAIARQFALLQVKEGVAEAGSRAVYQQQIMQVQEWTSDHVWAVQKLGFKIPKNIKVIAPEDIKISPDQDEP